MRQTDLEKIIRLNDNYLYQIPNLHHNLLPFLPPLSPCFDPRVSPHDLLALSMSGVATSRTCRSLLHTKNTPELIELCYGEHRVPIRQNSLFNAVFIYSRTIIFSVYSTLVLVKYEIVDRFCRGVRL